MYKIGLTGGIGSGKSQVSGLFQQWGAAIIDTDVIAHDLTGPGGAAIDPIRRLFGPEMIADDGSLERELMRELVFTNPSARGQLQAIIHPMIQVATERHADRAQGCYLVFVVPLLVESGHWRERVDRICVVDCDPETQRTRVQARSGLTSEAIARIMAAQASREARLAVADDVVLNDGKTTLGQLTQRARAVHDAWIVQAAR